MYKSIFTNNDHYSYLDNIPRRFVMSKHSSPISVRILMKPFLLFFFILNDDLCSMTSRPHTYILPKELRNLNVKLIFGVFFSGDSKRKLLFSFPIRQASWTFVM